MGDRPRRIREAPVAADASRIEHVDNQVRSRIREHAHLARIAHHSGARLHLRPQRRVGHQAFQHLGMLIADHVEPRAVGEDVGQLD